MADLRLVRPQTLFVTRYNYSTRCVHVHVCVQVCGLCCFGGADGCIPVTMLVGVCQCCSLLMFVCLPLLGHFPCCKTW